MLVIGLSCLLVAALVIIVVAYNHIQSLHNLTKAQKEKVEQVEKQFQEVNRCYNELAQIMSKYQQILAKREKAIRAYVQHTQPMILVDLPQHITDPLKDIVVFKANIK